jgi:arylsulfatase A-like enzyme
MPQKRTVLVVCDGLRADLITPDLTPNLTRLKARGRWFANHRSVFPSTTRTTSASISTGCHPGRHGLQGNAVALDEGAGLVPLTAGAPDFCDRLRKATGKTLRVPTMAERVKEHGGSIVFSNVSPGAAYFQDPDGHGHVYHRSGSYGPGLAPIEGDDALKVSHDHQGDTAMTTRFIEEVLHSRKPAAAVLWQCEPDHSQHGYALGAPEHLQALSAADANAGRVADAIAELNAAGEDILLLIASDHGHETVRNIIDLEALLIDAGFKRDRDSHECVVASQGLSAFIYLSDDARPRLPEIARWLEGVEGIGSIHAGDALAKLGQRTDSALAIVVDGGKSDDANEFGISGLSDAFFNRFSTETAVGSGQHGGLGINEQNPFLIAIGAGFAADSQHTGETSAVDLAPTLLRHLGRPVDGMDGAPLQSGA